MTSQERVRLVLAHKEPDRVPIHDSPWSATIDRWKDEGLPHHIPVEEYFGFEMAGIGFDSSPRFPVRTLEKNDEFITETNSYGGTRRNFRDHSTTPEIIDYPVKTREDWYAIKKRLEPSFTRIDWVSTRNRFERARSEGKFITLAAVVGYDLAQNYIRTEELLMALITEPVLVRDIFRTQADLVLAMAKMMIDEGFKFDAIFFFNDMGYRNGPLFSPKIYRELLFDIDREMYDFCHANGVKTILHCCGNVKALVPHMIEAGLDCLQPLEVKAGMDVVELKREFGHDLAFMGGIDTRLMADPDPSKIEAEIARKFEAAKKGGGYIYHSDHSIPKTVSFQQYCNVMRLAREYGVY